MSPSLPPSISPPPSPQADSRPLVPRLGCPPVPRSIAASGGIQAMMKNCTGLVRNARKKDRNLQKAVASYKLSAARGSRQRPPRGTSSTRRRSEGAGAAECNSICVYTSNQRDRRSVGRRTPCLRISISKFTCSFGITVRSRFGDRARQGGAEEERGRGESCRERDGGAERTSGKGTETECRHLVTFQRRRMWTSLFPRSGTWTSSSSGGERDPARLALRSRAAQPLPRRSVSVR